MKELNLYLSALLLGTPWTSLALYILTAHLGPVGGEKSFKLTRLPMSVGIESTPKFKFTTREMALILLLSQGKTSKDIADGLGLTVRTIEIYRSRVLDKAGVKNTSELLTHCHNNGIL